jgi:hypothetical protein
MIKKIQLILVVLVLISLTNVNAQENRWARQDGNAVATLSYEIPSEYTIFQLDEQALVNDLANTPDWSVVSARQSQVVISIPNMDGEIERFTIAEASVMVPELQAQFPNIRSYVGQGVDNPEAILRMSYSPQEGFGGMIRKAGAKTIFIAKTTNDNYVLYNRIDNGTSALRCSTPEFGTNTPQVNGTSHRDANSGQLNIFRLALTCNGEYGAWAGGTTATVLAKFNATMTRVNGVYEQELAIHMNIINNTAIMYFNAATDPYNGLVNSEIQTNLDAVVGSANYDIGHLVGQGGNGGNAGCIGCICTAGQKGSGYTSRAIPQGDAFDIDFVAHEMGHQFGGNHTWTSYNNGTSSVPGNEGQGANLEPGSGSTIMAYAGITGANAAGVSTDVQSNSDAYFHFYSIQQITNYIASTNCQTTTALTQATPTANAGANYTIPKNTPFVLTGAGTSGGTTTYCWEENDLGGYSVATTFPTPTSNSGPAFRSITPTTNPKRYFPAYTSVYNGAVTDGAIGTKWELLNTVGRTYNFKLTVRDNIANGAQNASDESVVTVNGTAGPFEVTSQSTSEAWATGETKTITWNVAGTTANGINTANVNILLVDASNTVLATLLSNTPNDGTQTITVPNVTAGDARVMVQAIGNVFYAINSTNIGVNTSSSCSGLCTSSGSTQFADGVTLVSFNTINQASTGASDYTDYTAINTHVSAGETHNLTVNLNTDGNYTESAIVWIDWNRDCTFNTTDEQYLLGDIVNSVDGATSNSPLAITVPASVTPGEITMRVTGAYTGGTTSLPTSCQTGFYGEVEDYTLIIDATAAVAENEFNNFSINPNPNNGNFNLELSSNQEDINIQIFDVRGRLIFNNSFNNTNTVFRKSINLNNVKAGIYLVKVSDKKHFSTERIIIK